jgi:hypothetical protein
MDIDEQKEKETHNKLSEIFPKGTAILALNAISDNDDDGFKISVFNIAEPDKMHEPTWCSNTILTLTYILQNEPDILGTVFNLMSMRAYLRRQENEAELACEAKAAGEEKPDPVVSMENWKDNLKGNA